MLVIDASAVIELLLGRAAAESVAAAIREHDFDLHAPHLVDVEVLSALRRVVAAGDASPARAAEAVDDLIDLPLERYAHEAFVPRMWELRENFTAYDAAYLALAEVLVEEGAPLLTADTRLARAASEHTGVEIALAT
jgi:predicted nucleic acid-binding protein